MTPSPPRMAATTQARIMRTVISPPGGPRSCLEAPLVVNQTRQSVKLPEVQAFSRGAGRVRSRDRDVFLLAALDQRRLELRRDPAVVQLGGRDIVRGARVGHRH